MTETEFIPISISPLPNTQCELVTTVFPITFFKAIKTKFIGITKSAKTGP